MLARAFVLASAAIFVMFFILSLKVRNLTLFQILYWTVPGATAIRVGYRGMVVANLFAVCAIALTFDRLFRLSLQQPQALFRRGAIVCLAALLALAAAEQINLGRPAHLSRKFEREHMALVGKPPENCRTFYAAHQMGRAPYEVQIDAMMIALAQRLPTINGYSGLTPPGWDFYDTTAADYEQRAKHWALSRGIENGLCRIDVTRGQWSTVLLDRDRICSERPCSRQIVFGSSPEFQIDLSRNGNSAVFVDANWVGPEPLVDGRAARQKSSRICRWSCPSTSRYGGHRQGDTPSQTEHSP